MEKKSAFSFLKGVSVILAAGLVFTACKKDSDSSPPTPIAALMSVNLAADKPAVAITLSGNVLTTTPLTFPGYSGGYQQIYTGSRDAASYDANTSSALATTTFAFDTSRYYSLFVLGANNVYSNLVVNDAIDALPTGSGQAFIRYINAIPDSTSSQVTITSNGSNVFNDNAAYKSISAFQPVSPGDISIAVSNGGTVNTSRTITIEQDKVYTVLLAGLPSSTDSTTAVQVRYIENGSLSANGGQ